MQLEEIRLFQRATIPLLDPLFVYLETSSLRTGLQVKLIAKKNMTTDLNE